MELLFFAVVAAAIIGAVVWFKSDQQDKALDLALVSMHAEARAKLSPDDMARLDAQIRELAAVTHVSAAHGMSAKQASQMGKRAAIQSIASSLEIDRMFSGKQSHP